MGESNIPNRKDNGVAKGMIEMRIERTFLHNVSNNKFFRWSLIDGKKAFQGVKTGQGFSRQFEEEECDIKTFYFQLRNGNNHIVKHRKKFPQDNLVVDVFNKDLVGLAIAEFTITEKEKDSSFYVPPWLSLGKEITNSIDNYTLAKLQSRGLDPSAIINRVNKPLPLRIVLTGGPGCGKTTALNCLAKKHGHHLMFFPELATDLILTKNINPFTKDGKIDNLGSEYKNFQFSLYETQASLEFDAIERAISDGTQGVIFDRGRCDIVAYLSDEKKEFERMFKHSHKYDYNNYDLVIQLRIPPANIYQEGLKTNAARTEKYSQAEMLDHKIEIAWQHHPHYHSIPYYQNFDEKINAIEEVIMHFLNCHNQKPLL